MIIIVMLTQEEKLLNGFWYVQTLGHYKTFE